MKKYNRIYNFFIGVALIFWNPLTFYFIYFGTPLLYIKLFWLIYSVLFLSGLFCIYLISQDRLNEKLRNIVLSLAFFGIFLGLIMAINGFMDGNSDAVGESPQRGLIFPKNHTVEFKTVEYSFDVKTNSLGLRDKEISIEKNGKYRILCFGDSWTMGFGVEVEKSWPKKLQDYLIDEGYKDIEVINCGRGGQYTTKYLEFMEKTIPLLKPDLVLVGVLQIDDLAQLHENHNENKQKLSNKSVKEKIQGAFKVYIKYSFDKIMNINNENKKSIKRNNKEAVRNRIKRFDYLQLKQYELLEDTIKSLFETGNLNPALLNYYVTYTFKSIVFNDPNHPVTQFAIDKMNTDLYEMKALNDKHDSKLIFVNLPIARLTGHHITTTPMAQLSHCMQQLNKIDSIYKQLAVQNDLPYIELTDHFLKLENKEKYFYRFDGHPNEHGYNEIARFISKEITKLKLLD